MRRAFIAIAGLVLTAGVPAGAESSAAFKVVVNPKVTGRTIPRDVLAQIYLGKAQRWGDGREIVAVDLSSTSAVRGAFSGTVLGMPVDGVKNYWLRNAAAGRRPPMIKASDEDVIAFVSAEPGGIGYVSESAAVPATVRVVPVH